MSRVLSVISASVLLAAAGHAQPAIAPMDFTRHQQRAGELFHPKFVTASGSELTTAADNLLLMCQAVAAVIVVAGIIAKVRKDQVQMEGIASMLLKVAFIALVPTLRVYTLETADAAASALGYHAASTGGAPSPLSSSMWGLLREWAPPGSPYLDALETQSAEPPGSGDEEAWALHAWNWAKGVGTTTGSMADAVWQSVSGGMRAGAVFTACGTMACATSVTLILMHVSEVLRYLLFFVGCALLPVFIAALGIDALRAQAVRFIVILVSIACWPVGWALANGVTAIMARGLIAWIGSTSVAALTLGSADPVPPLSIAAPYVGWGALFLFMGATIAICLWVVGTVLYAPMAIGKLVSSGADATALLVGAGDLRHDSVAIGSRAAVAITGSARAPRTRNDGTAVSTAFSGAAARTELGSARLRAGISDLHTGARLSPLRGVAPPTNPPLGGKPANARIAAWLPPPREIGGN